MICLPSLAPLFILLISFLAWGWMGGCYINMTVSEGDSRLRREERKGRNMDVHIYLYIKLEHT